MRRVGVLFLFMLILVLTAAPIEVTAADGDLSGDSVTSFSETTDDDRMLYPDCDEADTDDYTLAGSFFDGSMLTHSVPMDSTDWVAWNTASGTATTDGEYVQINDTSVGANAQLMIADDEAGDLQYGWLMLDIHNLTGTWKVTYFRGTLRAYSSDTGVVRIELSVATPEYYIELNNRYEAITFDWMLLTDTYFFEAEGWAGYCDSFASVSDCLIMDDEGDDTFSSDGDLLHFESKTDSENDGESVYSNVPSLVGQYLEIRYRLNTTSLAIFAVGTYSSDGGLAGNINWFGMTITTSWTTSKFPINSDTVIESVRLYIYHVTGQPPVDLQVDYLRIGPADEMGFSHDGSTTAGTGGTATVVSDGDVLNITGAAGSLSTNIFYDPTTTISYGDYDYYQFLEFSISEVNDGNGDGNVWLCRVVDSDSFITVSGYNDDTGVFRYNLKASELTEFYHIQFYLSHGELGDWFTIDYVKLYSIANHTVTQSGAGTDDYLYTDSGILYSSIDDGYIEMNHDPALTVSTPTYNVWNVTTQTTAPQSAYYVSSWSDYSSETRGPLTSGTLTDLKLNFTVDASVSAITFIEDGTAPLIVRSSANPPEPDDDEGVVLKAVVDDGVEVYSVKFNAIVYPTGFSDVDYDATEQTDNLWMYSFGSLNAGNYTFKVIASDGANENDLTEYAYIDFVVREAIIIVEEITLIGAGSDFSMMTFSARINRDCSFTIYEESASSPESDTHTGSVTAPSFNLAWTKLDVDDANVNFTIRFTSGSLTYNYTSQYQVAKTTFYVSTVTQMVSLDTVTVTGRISKLGAYQVYDDLDVLKDYGSITDLDFKIQFTRWGGYDEQNHDFAIKFTNGSQTCWYNSSFYAFKKPVVAPFQTTDPNTLYAFTLSFWTFIAVVAVGGMVVVQGKREITK